MELDWDDIRWMQQAYDVAGGDLPTPLPLLKAALSLLDGQDERPVLMRSESTDDTESWTLLVLDTAALVHVRVKYQPRRDDASGRRPDLIEDDVQELHAARVPLASVRAEVVGVPAARVSHGGRTLQWRTNFIVAAPEWGIEEAFEVSRMNQDYSRTAAEEFLRKLVAAQSAR